VSRCDLRTSGFHTLSGRLYNVKRWRWTGMPLRWTAPAMLEAKRGFRRLKAHTLLAALRIALKVHHEKSPSNLLRMPRLQGLAYGSDRFTIFNKPWDISEPIDSVFHTTDNEGPQLC
jgi:hypothetical protein